MPRIDPQQLLKCLSVLLSSNGGIKSQDEVQRLASLMTKFSKKLVSKCIYVSILKATKTDLLIMFMSAGGWDLTYSWLSDGVTAKNWPLVRELVDLLLICPVDIDRLKTNACPKLIKTLSKDITADEHVRLLACKVVDHWLRIVKGDMGNSVSTGTVEQNGSSSGIAEAVPETGSSHVLDTKKQNAEVQHVQEVSDKNSVSDSGVKNDVIEVSSDEKLPVYKITIRDGKKVLAEISGDRRSSTEVTEEDSSTGTEDVNQEDEEPLADVLEEEVEDDDDNDLIKPVKIKKRPPLKKPNKQNAAKKAAKVHSGIKKNSESIDLASASSIGKSTKEIKYTTKQANKKVKSQALKSNSKNKTETHSPKVKELVNAKNVSEKKDVEEPVSIKPKEKLLSLSLKNKKLSSSIKEKALNNKNDGKEKNMNMFLGNDISDKEKETLSKFITPPISKVGKIPKKTSTNKEEKQSEEKNRTLKDEKVDNKTDFKKSLEIKKPEIKRPEKKLSISVEPKRNVPTDSRPKTVKMYNSKFRSTGLEEEIKPPPPRSALKKLPPVLGVPEKKISKRSSPPPETPVPEKKPKPESPQEEKKPLEKVGGIKLIPPKPKPMFLQESDVFMDAMLAANTMKEPRKRKRRASVSKDSAPSEGKKDSPSHSPKGEDTSPSSIKPTFKFYQETMDTSGEEDRGETKADELMKGEPDELGDDQGSMGSEDGPNGPLKGVLAHSKSKKQKKSVTWKEGDKLETTHYFELDETERVNVTKNFADMKNMEREQERENVQIARKLPENDVMEERTHWRALIPIDIAAPVVAPGKNSQEKDIQYAREKTVPPAVYFNKRAIPDSGAEPDLEIHATTDPVLIPMDDITGSTDSINDFTNTPWPEPKGLAPTPTPVPAPPPPPVQPAPPPAFQPGPGPMPSFPPQTPFPPMGPFMPGPVPPGMPINPAGDCWRTGDGKVVTMPPEMFAPQGMMPPGMPPMGPGPMMLPPGVTPDMPFAMPMPPGPNPTPEEMAQFNAGFGPMGPPGPQMFGPPPPPMAQGPAMGGNWQNPGGGGGNWFSAPDNDQPPVHHNQGNNQGRYQGNNWRGGGGRGGGRNPDGWGNGGNSRTPVCNNFIKRGFCRNATCRYRHPR